MGLWGFWRAARVIGDDTTPVWSGDRVYDRLVVGTVTPAVWAAVNLLTSTICGLPMQVVRRMDDGTVEVDRTHRVNGLLMAPSREASGLGRQWWEQLIRLVVSHGSAYAVPMRNGSGEVVGLRQVHCIGSDWEGPVGAEQIMRSIIPASCIGTTERRPDSELLSLQGPGMLPGSLQAPDPIREVAGVTIRLLEAIKQQPANRLLNDPTGLFLRPEREATPSDNPQSRAANLTAMSRAIAGNKTVEVPPGYDLQTYQSRAGEPVSPNLAAIGHLAVSEVARIFGLPPRIIGHYAEGMRNASSFSDAAEDLERYTVRSWAARIGAALTARLIPPREHIEDGVEVRLDTSSVAIGSQRDRADIAMNLVANSGIMTINEGRELLGLAAREDGDRLLSPKGAPDQRQTDGGMMDVESEE